MSTIKFSTKLFKVNSWTILKLPTSASRMLSSRGVVSIKGTINGFYFQTTLEPDGKGGHWLRFTTQMHGVTKAKVGDTVALEIENTKEWLEPELPVDLKNALSATPKAYQQWIKVTPNAHWDWIRWIRSTKQSETRKQRIKRTCEMLVSGKKRPCCFNRNLCSVSEVSKNWILLDSTKTT